MKTTSPNSGYAVRYHSSKPFATLRASHTRRSLDYIAKRFKEMIDILYLENVSMIEVCGRRDMGKCVVGQVNLTFWQNQSFLNPLLVK